MKNILVVLIAAALSAIAGGMAIQLQSQARLRELLQMNQQLERDAMVCQEETAQLHQALAQRDAVTEPWEEEELEELAGEDDEEEEGDLTEIVHAESYPADGLMLDLLALLNVEDTPALEAGNEPPPAWSEMSFGTQTDSSTAGTVEGLVEEEQKRLARLRAEQARQEMLDYLQALSEASEDPLEQERLDALAEYYDAVFELRKNIEYAQTDAEREELSAALQQNVAEMNALIRDQQNHLLQQVAQQFGVKKPGKQRRFTNTLRQTYQSPFFSLSPPRRKPVPKTLGG